MSFWLCVLMHHIIDFLSYFLPAFSIICYVINYCADLRTSRDISLENWSITVYQIIWRQCFKNYSREIRNFASILLADLLIQYLLYYIPRSINEHVKCERQTNSYKGPLDDDNTWQHHQKISKPVQLYWYWQNLLRLLYWKYILLTEHFYNIVSNETINGKIITMTSNFFTRLTKINECI